MATPIGQNAPASLVRVERETVRRQVRTGAGQLLGQKKAEAEDATLPNTRAGFGKDTLSPQGAALATVSTNLRRARRLVPSVEETQQRAREAISQEQDAARQRRERLERVGQDAAERESSTPQATVSLRPRVEPRARFFARDPFAQGQEPNAVDTRRNSEQGSNAAAQTASAQQRDGSAQLLDLLA